MPRGKRLGKHLTPEEFVREYFYSWKHGESLYEMAARVGVSPQSVYKRKKSYVEKGLNFPTLKEKEKVDVGKLNELMKELL